MVEEKIVIGAETKHPLNGLLTVPSDSSELLPAVILVHGSGPSDMDASVGNNKPFKDFAEGLSKKGVAVLRYDKRTLIYGKEMKDDTALSVKEEVIDDVLLATALVRSDSRIDANKVFIIGQSLGGMLAPRIDAEGGNFAGIIIMGGSPRKLEDIMIDQNNDTFGSLNAFMRLMAGRKIAESSAKFHDIYNLSDEEAKSKVVLGKHVKAYYFKEMGEHPATQYLDKLEKPLLMIHGEKDFQMSLAKDFNAYKELIGHRENVMFKLYPNLNPLFMPSVYGDVRKAKKEYEVPQHVDQQVIEDIWDWIQTVY